MLGPVGGGGGGGGGGLYILFAHARVYGQIPSTCQLHVASQAYLATSGGRLA